MTVELCTPDDVVTLTAHEGQVRLTPGRVATPDIILAGPTEPVVGLLLGRISPAEATAGGVTTRGPARMLRGLRP